MERIRCTSPHLIAQIDKLVEQGLYPSRAEYIRELIRNDLKARKPVSVINTPEDMIRILEQIPEQTTES